MLSNLNAESMSAYKAPSAVSFQEIIDMQLKVPNCSLMKEGYSNSEKLFYYCICDPEYQNPICESCLYECHGQHWKGRNLKEIIKEACEGICSCGSNNHIIIMTESEKNNSFKEKCMFIEWEETAKTYRYYKNNSNNFIVCPFCYECCVENKKNFVVKNFGKNETINCE